MNGGEARRRALATLGAAIAAVLVLAASFSLVLGSGTEAGAVSSFVQAFGAEYPDAAGSRIAVCLLCHSRASGGEDYMNPYGIAVDEELRFRAVEDRDSDGDGFTNIEEIRAHTFPGNSTDNPNTVVTTTTVPGGTTTSTAPGSGGALYAANCQGCHGFGGGNLVPTTLSRSQLISVIGGGRGSMPGFSGALTATQIGSIADSLLGWSQTTTTTQPGATTTTTAGGTVSGSGVYSQYCSGCHGAAPGNLAGRGLTATRVGSLTSTGTAGMPGFSGTLSAAQINAVASYVASLGGGATTTTTTAGGSTTTTSPGGGAGLYAANCANCHGAAGEGGIGGAIRDSGFDAAALRTLIRDGYETMPGFGDRLGEEDIAALAEFTATLASGGATTTLAPDDGSAGPVAHGGGDAGTGGASWWKIALAVFLALAAAAGFGVLLVRSARQVFRF